MARLLRFGGFELDIPAYELRRGSQVIKMERLAMDLLLFLIARRGELVSRDQIVEKLWGKDVFLDAEHGVNTAVRKVRLALEDHPTHPRFVQTTPGKGYRFIASVHEVSEQEKEPGRVMLAVLPFLNLGGNPSDDYLSDGLTEETIAHLGAMQPQRLGIIARTSSMAYKGTTKAAKQIGAELQVDYLLESSVRRQGKRVRITVQLIRVADESHLWAENYDHDSRNFLGMQRELASAVCAQIKIQLSGEQSAKRLLATTRSAAAYDLYLRGRYAWNQLTPPNLRRAIELFQAAVNEDPQYAMAYAGMADAYAYLPLISDAAPQEYWSKAKAAAERAALINPELSESLTSLGIVKFWMDWKWGAAETALRRAAELDGSNTMAHRLLAHVLSQSGRHDEAVARMAVGRQLDPFSPVMQAISAQFLFQARRYPEARERAKAALTLDDKLWVGHVMLAQVLERMGESEAAIRECEAAFKLSGGNTHPLALKGYVLATSGRREEAREIVRLLETIAADRFVPAYNVALVYAGMGDEAAFQWLNRACEERDVHMVFLTADPKWDDQRVDPRFQALLQRTGMTLPPGG
jgi:TolB-like protein/Flp pilus assembly protein TadD